MTSSEPPRILLVEDDYESMHDLKEYIEDDLGWIAELAADEGLLDRLASQRFDLILLDLMIQPESYDADNRLVRNVHFEDVPWRKTGPEFLRRLRRGEFCGPGGSGTSPDVPVLILSAVAGYSVEEEFGTETLFSGYVEKPFRLQELSDRLHRLLKRKE